MNGNPSHPPSHPILGGKKEVRVKKAPATRPLVFVAALLRSWTGMAASTRASSGEVLDLSERLAAQQISDGGCGDSAFSKAKEGASVAPELTRISKTENR